jgi:hypothetical protein
VTDHCSGRLIITDKSFGIYVQLEETVRNAFANSLLSSCQAHFSLITKYFLRLHRIAQDTGSYNQRLFRETFKRNESMKELASFIEETAGEGIKFPWEGNYRRLDTRPEVWTKYVVEILFGYIGREG